MEYGSNVNDGYDNLPSLLWLAASRGSEVMTRALLEEGANPTIEGSWE